MVDRLALIGFGAVSNAYSVPARSEIPGCQIEWFVDSDLGRGKQFASIQEGIVKILEWVKWPEALGSLWELSSHRCS